MAGNIPRYRFFLVLDWVEITSLRDYLSTLLRLGLVPEHFEEIVEEISSRLTDTIDSERIIRGANDTDTDNR